MSYLCLSECRVPPSDLLCAAATFAVIGYIATLLGRGRRPRLRRVAADLKHVWVFCAFGCALAPVLYKLTDTISTDTIHTASFVALFLHLLAHNYDTVKSGGYRADALSLNAALFASVCLASRSVNLF